MNVPVTRPVVAVVFAILTALVLLPGLGALSNRVVNAADHALENSPATEPTISTEASAIVAANAAPVTMQSAVMGCSAPSFSAPSYFGIGAGTIPVSVAVGDFNLDGKPDLVTANQTTNNVSVLLGNGTGSYGTVSNFAAGGAPTSVAVADFNLDGKPDLAVTNINTQNVVVLLGNGAGGFSAPTAFAVGNSAQEVIIADFNLDGKPDMAVAVPFSNAAAIFLGNGSGGFSGPTNFTTGANPFTITTADFNGDGKPDVATGNYTSNNVSVLLGNGNGTFGAKTDFAVAAASNPQSIRAGDFNQDGKPDLVTSNQATANVSVLLNNGSGGFGAATNFPTGTNPLEMAIGDFNLDGKPDLAATNSSSSSVSILLGNGSGGFGATTNLPVNNSVRAVVAADLNLDGKLDLAMRSATGSPSVQNVAVLLNTCSAQPCSSIAFAEAMGSPYSQGTGSTTDPIYAVAADFNMDGKPDVAVANFGTNNIMVLLGNGSGGFAAAAGSPFAAGSTPESLAAGDYNLDGKLDLAVANGIFPGTVTILPGNGSGGFGAGSPVSLGPVGARSITAGDFNLDGKLDLATANGNSNNVSILLGNGMGGFAQPAGSPISLGAGTNLYDIATGDFNLDGKPDLATANASGNNVMILLGDGAGNFAPSAASPIATGGTFPQVVRTGDFNLDGKPDLAVGNGQSHNITILLGNGMGGFAATAGSPIAGTFAPRSASVGDFNADGKPDILFALSVSTQMAVLKGDGTGNFALTIMSVPGAPYGIAGGDFNLDGRLDLATADLDVDNVRILLNTCPLNTPPSITAMPLTVQQTTSALNAQIAMVNDPEDAETSLVVTVNGSASATVTGVTVSNISVDAMGVVRADVAAACGASSAAFTLTVTDTQSGTNTATLSVTVTPETTLPTLSCPANLTQSAAANLCTAVVIYATPTATDNCPGATVACNPPSGSTFVKGTTTVTCTATDVAGNTAMCTFTVTVNDTQAPQLTCPANLTQSTASGQCTATVTYSTPTASDNCAGVGSVSCTPASGATFNKGTTTVTCNVSDAAGNPASCSFTVTVNDTQAPTLTCPTNITVPTASGQCTATVTYTTPAATDNCAGVGAVTCTPASGATFPKGTTTVTCSVTDAAGNPSSCSFTVMVNDTQPPTLTCPANITQTTNAGCLTVTYTTPAGSDNCAGVSVVCAPPSGTCFAIGTTTVTCTATDASNNTASCSFTVTIVPCTITCPANVTTTNTAGQCGATVNYTAPTTTGNCGTVTCVPPAGTFFAKGTTTVTCSTQVGPTCSFTVTVNDAENPVITCPANVTQGTDANLCSAVVNYALPSVTDNCAGVGTVSCTPAAGATFPKGTTTVSCSVTDAAGNNAGCSFTVTVNDTQAPTIPCPANIVTTTASGQCSATVTYTLPKPSDNCSAVGAVTCTPASGAMFTKGVTTVTCSVSDTAGNPASCSFTVTVNDTQPPTLTCPANQVRPTDANQCAAVVSYASPAVNDNCPGAGVACSPASGSSFPKGTTTVSCTATDASGNTASCSFTVTVNDAQAPTIVCPANVVATTPIGSTTCTVVNYTAPVASDNCAGVTVVCSPASGSCFPIGTTTVSCTATDAAANQTACAFTVTVFDVCLQDDSNAAVVLLFNSFTGDYLFCCSGVTFSGRGTVQKLGSTYTLAHNTAERRVTARFEGAMNRGTASLQSPPGITKCSITDRDTRNNSCACQ